MDWTSWSHEEILKTIRKETRTSLLFGGAFILSILIYTGLAYFVSFETVLERKLLEDIYFIFNGLSVLMILSILALRRRIYLSKKLGAPNRTLVEILQKWRQIDLIFYALAESISLFGLAVTFLGLPFIRTFHFFVTSGILILILLPLEMKVSARLQALSKTSHGGIC